MAPPRRRLPKGTALGKLEGRIFLKKDGSIKEFERFIKEHSMVLGRSDLSQIPHGDFLRPAARDQCDLGLGDDSKLSRVHAQIYMPADGNKFVIKCKGKNGVNISLPPWDSLYCMNPSTKPVVLEHRTLIQLGECIFCFLLPTIPSNPPNGIAASRKWTKTEQHALRTLLLRFGYGRWDVIIKHAAGRLKERPLSEIKEQARTFLTLCYIFADESEKKLMGILLNQSSDELDDDSLEDEVNSLVQKIDEEKSADEKAKESKKYKRWARKLRMAYRLERAFNYPSLENLRTGDIVLRNPPPESCWSNQDDYDLITGSIKHGLGHNEAIRSDTSLGFLNRYRPQPPSRRGKVPGKSKDSPQKSSEMEISKESPGKLKNLTPHRHRRRWMSHRVEALIALMETQR